MTESLPPKSSLRIIILSMILFSLCIMVTTSMVTAEKVSTTLTIQAVPDNPTLNHGFHVTGTLASASGEILGNKRVVLESSSAGMEFPGSFSYLAIDDTNKEGVFDFFRPKYSPPEYLRVTFAGNVQYTSATSPVIPVRGIGTSNPDKVNGTGSLTVRTDPAGADIYVDSVHMGTTPSILQGLLEGAHTLKVGKKGYQNETMEAYISPNRGSSFSITLNPEGLGVSRTGISSSLSFEENASVPFGEPDFSLDNAGVSMRLYANTPGETNSSDKRLQVTTVVSNDTVDDGYNVMIIMTDH